MQNHDENFWTLDTLIEGHYAEQIFKFFTEHITKGDLMPDERLPSYRVLAEKLGVHRNTMINVYRMLQREDWIYIKVAQGTFVSETFPGYEKVYESAKQLKKLPVKLNIDQRIRREKAERKVNFTAIGFDTPSPKYFPVSHHYDFMYDHVKRYKTLTQMDQMIDFRGLDLKKAILKQLNVMRRFAIRSAGLEVIIGRQESLERVLNTALAPGDVVINTSPKDILLRRILNKCEVKCYDLEGFGTGFIENLRRFLNRKKVKAVYIRPQCSYPASQTLGAPACEKLVELAKIYGFYIIEEDDYHEFWYETKPFKELVRYDHNGHVIYLGALSLLTPYMQQTRTIIAAEDFITLMKSLPVRNYIQRDILIEKTITNLLNSKKIWKHIKRMKRGMEVHLEEAWAQMDNYLRRGVKLKKPSSGLSLWIEFPSDRNLQESMDLVLKSGQQIPYHPDGYLLGRGVNCIRLGFGSWDILEAQTAAKLLHDKFLKDYGNGYSYICYKTE